MYQGRYGRLWKNRRDLARVRKPVVDDQGYEQAKAQVYGRTTKSHQVIEGKSESYTPVNAGGVSKVIAGSRNQFPHDIDVSWLPAAAVTYDISPNIDDYLIVDVSAVTIDVPNRNQQGFPLEEVTFFDHAYGCMIYQTFVGKPSCKDHYNEVDEDTDYAKGVIFAAAMQYVPTYDIYKIRLLQGFDRTKDTRLTNEIHNGKREYYSMGSLVSNFVCPITGEIEGSSQAILGRQPKGSIYMDSLVFQLCLGAVYIENSSVVEPADPLADGVPFV